MTPLVRSACLTNYVPLAESAGLNAHALLSVAGIDRAYLENPDLKISAPAFSRLLEASARASGWRDFGLRLAETRQISVLGSLALVVREQTTGRKALEALFRHMSLHNDSVREWIEEEAGLAIIQVALIGRGQTPLRQSTELVVGVLHRLMRQLMPHGWQARTVCFVHSAPPDLRTHRRVFGNRIEFDAPFTGIVCRSADLDVPRQADPMLELYARQYLHSVSVLPARTTADKVRQLALTLMPSGNCTLDQIAGSMGVDVRTVRRRLRNEQESFTLLLEALRRDLVPRYLDMPGRQLSEVAGLLGFSSLSAFSRWFREQFGCSVTAWRCAGRSGGTASVSASKA